MSKNKAYWDKRHIQWIKNQDKADNVTASRLERDYKRVARDLENDIAGYFNRYGKDDVLEYRTMLKGLSKKDKELLYQDMETFAEKYPQYEHLMPVRESVYKLNRMQGLHYSAELKLLEMGAIEQEVFERHLLETYGNNYEALMVELGMGGPFNAMNDEIARRTVFTRWIDDKNFSDRIWANKEKLMSQLRNEYRNALVRGVNYAKITEMIAKRLDVGAYDARRLVWTESSFILNQAHVRPYIDAGLEEYAINAIMDSRTSDICRELDGERFRFDEIVVGENFPPLHPMCRSTFIGVGLDKLLD